MSRRLATLAIHSIRRSILARRIAAPPPYYLWASIYSARRAVSTLGYGGEEQQNLIEKTPSSAEPPPHTEVSTGEEFNPRSIDQPAKQHVDKIFTTERDSVRTGDMAGFGGGDEPIGRSDAGGHGTERVTGERPERLDPASSADMDVGSYRENRQPEPPASSSFRETDADKRARSQRESFEREEWRDHSAEKPEPDMDDAGPFHQTSASPKSTTSGAGSGYGSSDKLTAKDSAAAALHGLKESFMGTVEDAKYVAKGAVKEVSEKAEDLAGKAKAAATGAAVGAKAGAGAQKLADTLHRVKEKVVETIHDLKSKGKDTTEQAKVKAEDIKEAVVEKGKEFAEKGKDAAETLKEKAKETSKYAKEKASKMKDTVESKGKEYAERGREAARDTSEYAKDKAETFKDKAEDLKDAAVSKGKEYMEQGREAAANLSNKAKETAANTEESLRRAQKEFKEKDVDTYEERGGGMIGGHKKKHYGFEHPERQDTG